MVVSCDVRVIVVVHRENGTENGTDSNLLSRISFWEVIHYKFVHR